MPTVDSPALRPAATEEFVVERPQHIKDQVYQLLKSYCLSLDFGEKLVERDLTEKLRVSRTPVREALSRLHAEGYIVAQGRSYCVPTFSQQDVRNMSQIRSLLEVEAARQAAEHPGNTGLADMRAALADMQASHRHGDMEAFNQNNLRFRQAWAERLENPLLLSTLNRTFTALQLVRFRSLSIEKVREFSLTSDLALMEAIASHDPALAVSVQSRKAGVMCDLIIEGLGLRH